ncbi:MAG: hypothetical protein ACLU99_11460 [Alphaproteobacteria bacterium]
MEKIFPLVKNLVAPALIFGCCLLAFYLNGSFADATNMTLHSLFYLLGFASFMVLLYFNQSKPAFFIICASLSYVLINFLKYKYQGEYTSSNAYQNLCLLAPLNFAFFISGRRKNSFYAPTSTCCWAFWCNIPWQNN